MHPVRSYLCGIALVGAGVYATVVMYSLALTIAGIAMIVGGCGLFFFSLGLDVRARQMNRRR